MSTTIDQRVVEMQFDNSHFEKNVRTSMSTLDKLKQSLNLTGAVKGLDNVSSAAKKVDMNGLGTAVETVRTKFSALEVMGVTALANITNQAVNTGKRMISALTIDPVKTGFQEYETQMKAIQTILANTSSKGSTLDDVNKALDELNEYADLTIYNFTEMTRNIGTFTAAGVDLDTSVSAIKGIANLAAVSGSTSQQASTAMYQLSQALAAGTVRLQDWNSVVNAGMGGEVFQNALRRTSEVLGTGAEAAIAEYGSFRDSLTKGDWLTTEVLTETLNQFTMAAEEGTKQWDEYKASLKEKGYTEEQAVEILKMANTATSAATEVKTLTQLWDVLKEAAQSGWSRTWRLIIGDFEDAKAFLSPLSEFLTGIIGRMADARNNLVEGVLNFKTPWASITEKLDEAGLGKIKKVSEAISEVTDKLEYYQDIFNRVWRGDYGNSDTGRYEKLDAEGYDHRVVQELVNKGDGYINQGKEYKLTMEEVEEAHKKFGLTMEKTTESTGDAAEAVQELSDETLINAGLTEDEIKLYRDLEEESKRTGKSISELADEMSKADGRTLLLESLKNIGSGLLGVFTSMKEAWSEIFPAPSVVRLYNIVKGINEFSEKLRLTEKNADGLVVLNENGEKLKRTFKGIFAALDVVLTIIGGPLKIAIKIVSQLLGAFGFNVLDVTAGIGDAIVGFRDWLDSVLDFTAAFEKLVTPVKNGVKAFKDWIDTLKESENLPQDIANGIVNGLGKAVGFVKSLFARISNEILGFASRSPDEMTSGFVGGLWNGIKVIGGVISELGKIAFNKLNEFLVEKGFKPIPADMISGFVNGIKDGAIDAYNAIVDFAKKIISKAKEVLGIASPSKVFIAIGGFIIAGLIAGLTNAFPGVTDFFTNLGIKCSEILSSIDWGSIFAGAMSAGLVVATVKMASALENLSEPFGAVGGLIKEAKGTLKVFQGTLKSFSKSIKANALKTIAISLAILVASIIALAIVINKMGYAELISAIVMIGILAGILVGLSVAMDKLSKSSASIGKDGVQINGLKGTLLGIAAAVLIMAVAVKIIGSLESDKAEQAFDGLFKIIAAMSIVLIAYGTFIKGKAAQNMDKAGSMLLKMGASMLLMAFVIKIISKLDKEALIKGGAAILYFAVIMGALAYVTKIAGKNADKIGATLLKISAAMLLMVLVIKMVSGIDGSALVKGGAAILYFSWIFVALTAATNLVGKDADKVGSTLLKISAAMMIMALVAKLCGNMSPEEMKTGLIAIGIFAAIIIGLVAATKLVGGNDLTKVSTTLIGMAIAMGVMALIAVLLGMVNTENLVKGITAVGILSAMMALMIAATRGAQDCKDNIIAMTVAIAIMAGAVAALSFIDPSKLAGSTAAMSILMGMFAVLIKSAGSAQKSIGTLIVMTVAVGLLAGMIYLLAQLPIDSVLGTALSLSALLVSLSAALFILTKTLNAGSIKDALLGVVALTAMALPLLAFVGVLALMQNVQNATTNALALVALSTALTVLLIPLSIIGAFVALTGGAILLGVVALTAMAVPLLAFIGVLALMQNIQNATGNVYLLIDLMTAMSDILVKISLVAPLAVIGVGALTALTALMVAFGVLATGIGALVPQSSQLQTFLNTGIPIMEQLAYGLGSVIGNFIVGFSEAVLTLLPSIGLALSQFMLNATPFINGVKMVDASVLAGVGILAAAILALTAVDLITGILSFMQGGSSFATLGTELSAFMINALPFMAGVLMINPTMMEGVKALAETILILTAADVLNGLTSWFTGGSSLTAFGEQLPALGTYLRSFADNLGTFDESTVATVNCAGQAIKCLAEAAKELPNEGGWAAKILGENSIATFGSYLPGLGTNLNEFIDNIGSFGEDQIATVDCAGRAIKALAEAAKELPNEGGWAAKILGDKSLATFGSYLPDLGTNLSSFITNLGTFGEDNIATVDCAGRAIKALADAADSIPNEGGWAAKIFGDKSLSTFGDKLPGLAEDLAGFVESLGTFGYDEIATVTSACKALGQITSLGNIDMEAVGSGMITFGDNMISFGGKLNSFVTEVSGVGSDAINSAIDKTNELIDFAKTVAGTDISGVATFGNSLKKLARDGITGFVKEFSAESPKTKVVSAANELLSVFVNAAENRKDSIKSKFQSIASDSVKQLSTKTVKAGAASAGRDIVRGFSKGISDQTFEAKAKAAAMAKAALAAAEEELGIESPSKEFYKTGSFAGKGFINALSDYGTKSYKASSEMALSAKNGLSNAISKVVDAVNGNMDMQPTICPVVDLSNVSASAGAINGMFNMTPSVGVLSNLNTINSMMTDRQNGASNDDVVYAINKLRKELGNISNTSYNINGLTYDDDSVVADAIRTLVRATKIEGRT